MNYRAVKKPYKTKLCAVCNEEIKEPKSNAQKRCDMCAILKCAFCGVSFVPQNKTLNHKFCSRRCKDNSLKGEIPIGLKNKRGVKPRTYIKRNKHGCVEDREWRIKIFERDKYRCVSCGIVGGKLNAHHIKPYKKYPDNRYEIDNGITLCVKCHAKEHTDRSNLFAAKIAAKRLGQEQLDFSGSE